MNNSLKIVKINSEYCDYLRLFDDKVPYNAGLKSLRPFIGVLFTVNNLKYFAPLSSPKDKHKKIKNNIDIIKIDGGNLGVINFNNMIPVIDSEYELFDLSYISNNESEKRWYKLLNEQYLWLNKNRDNIINKSNKLYNMFIDNSIPERIKIRCCNFILLEEKCLLYKKDI